MRLSSILGIILYCLSFATYFTVQKILVGSGIPPVLLSALVYSGAAIFFSLYLGIWDRRSFVIKSKKGLLIAIAIALSSSVIADLLVLYGLKVGSSITWSLLLCSAPLITYLLAIPTLGEKFKFSKLTSVIVSIVGAIIIIYVPGTGIDWLHGAPYFIAAVALFSVANILSQLVFKYITALQLTLIKLASTSIIMVSFVTLSGIKSTNINWVLVVINSLILLSANVLVNYVIDKAGATYFSVGANMAPLFVTLLSIIFMSTYPTWTQILGGIVIIISVFLFQRYDKRPIQTKI